MSLILITLLIIFGFLYKMTILVTGGAGFMGSNFILNCLKKYDEKNYKFR